MQIFYFHLKTKRGQKNKKEKKKKQARVLNVKTKHK